MISVRSFATVSFVALTAALAGCAVEAEPDEAQATASEDALTQAECDRIVGEALTKSKNACTAKLTAAESKKEARAALERGVVSALGAFTREIQGYTGANAAKVQDAIAECSALTCSGELSGEDVKAECSVERAFLQAACYVRNWPEIKAAATGIDFSDEMANLQDAWEKMDDQWLSLATQELSLRGQHGACSTYAGSDAQRAALNATCRASCNEDDATNVGKVQQGHGSACTPPGYEDVKDDLGRVVECGAMKRPLRSVGTVCECREERSCTQFAALAGSSERGKRCTTASGKSGFKKVVWDARSGSASLECR